MAQRSNSIDVRAWDLPTCEGQLGGSQSAKYLFSYLEKLAALESRSPITVVIESHYVDRHYLDDFQHYYARSFSAPSATCRRLHFFGNLTPADFEAEFERACSVPDQAADVSVRLSSHYLGFVVRRPLAGAPMGRTVLRTYPVDGRRHYCVVRPYDVNLAGLPLLINGLAYQQQDRGAAVCASTAVWSALQKVARVAGHRTPTPSAVTRAAESPFAASQGLSFSQMADAIHRLGYGAEAFLPLHNRALFRAQIVACLDSNLPVILLLERKREVAGRLIPEGHAITVTGYSEAASAGVLPDFDKVPAVQMRGAAVSVIYVHDDNLGSHAHYELIDSGEVDKEGYPKLEILRGRSNESPPDWWTPDLWTVTAALVPKPFKLRKSPGQLFFDLLALRPLFTQVFGIEFDYAIRFDSGTAYKHRLLTAGSSVEGLERPLVVDRTAIGAFLRAAAFPRHIGVLSLFRGPTLILEVVLDVTEVERNPSRPGVLAIMASGIPSNAMPALIANHLAQLFGCPILFGPPVVPRIVPAVAPPALPSPAPP